METHLDRFEIAPNVRILEADDQAETTLIIKAGKYYHLKGLARTVVAHLREAPMSCSEIDSKMGNAPQRGSSIEQLAQVLDGLLSRRLVAKVGEVPDPDSAEKNSGWRKYLFSSYLTIRYPFLPACYVQPVADLLSPIFNRSILIYLVPVMLIAQGVFCWFIAQGAFHSIKLLTWRELSVLLFLNYFSLFAHEFGHATACVHTGLPAGEIGVGFYLYIPAFYTDVTPAWSVPRKQRVIIDAGGIYVSLLIATVSSVLFLFYHSPVLSILTVLVDITIAANLNPFIRMDGYWILSDVLGVVNLMSFNKRMTKWLVSRLLPIDGVRSATRPETLDWGTAKRWGYFGYYLLFVSFICYAGFSVAVDVLPTTFRLMPEKLHLIVTAYRHDGIGWSLLVQLFICLVIVMPVVGLCVFVIRAGIKRLPFYTDRAVTGKE